MFIFNKENTLLDLIEINYHLLPVINRFGINLGQKEASLEKICLQSDLNIDFFLVVINTFHNKEYFPEEHFKSFSPILIIDYLKKTHSYYAEYVLPKLEGLLKKLIESGKDNNKELLLIEQFYLNYKKELIVHVQEEEELVFPYISNLVETGKLSSNYTIHSFEEEHSNVEDKLNDLKNLIVKYLQPVYDNNICNEFLITLLRFEKDISNHNRIESKILIPQILELENQ